MTRYRSATEILPHSASAAVPFWLAEVDSIMKSRLALAALSMIAFSITATVATSAPTEPPTKFVDVASAPGPQSPIVADDYIIGPQDTLDIAVFQVEDLSRTVRVENNGTVLLPLIGQVIASGKTSKQLSEEIAAEFSKNYVKDPSVTVTIKESSSRRVTIDGAVMQPGIYPISGTTTLLQAIALAQGPTDLADLKQVAIFRTNGGERMAAKFDLASIRSGKAADPSIMANDVIIVETSGGRRFLRNLGTLAPFFQLLLFF